MDRGVIIGLGIAAVFGLLPFAVRSMSPILAWAGIVAGLAVAVWAALPARLQPTGGPLALYVVAIAALFVAVAWQFSSATKASAPPPSLPVTSHPGAAQGSGTPAPASSAPSATVPPPAAAPTIISQGGAGGAATAGPGGVAIGGPGGNAGGLPGRGGDGGGDGIGGDGAGGGGGSVDGPDVWYPPGPSGYEVYMRAKGEKPDPERKQYGRGGMSPGYAEKYRLVEELRATYFRDQKRQPASVDEDIDAMPLNELNAALEHAGKPWRARIVQGYYEFFIPHGNR